MYKHTTTQIKRIIICNLVVILACLTTPAFLFAESDGDFDQEKRAKMKKFMQELDLNQDQKEAIKKFRQERGEIRKLQVGSREKLQELEVLFKNPKSSDANLRQAVEDITRYQGDIHRRKAENFIELRNSLTPEQLKKVLKLHEHMKNKMRERMKERGGRFGKNNREGDAGKGRGPWGNKGKASRFNDL